MNITLLKLKQAKEQEKDLIFALNTIYSDDTIIYRNVDCKLKIGNKFFHPFQIDMVIVSEESNVMILVPKYFSVSIKDIENYFYINNMLYNIVHFQEEKSLSAENKPCPNISFAKDKKSLIRLCSDSIRRTKNNDFIFDREINSELLIRYRNSLGIKNTMFRKKFKGIIYSDGEIILPMKNYENSNWLDCIPELFLREGINISDKVSIE